MGLLHYTTSVAAEKTTGEVARLLASAGARQILTDYGPDGRVTGLSFAVEGPLGRRSYSLPVDPAAVLRALQKDRAVPRRYANADQAERTAWRNVKAWIEAQLAMAATQMVALDQIMLPYMHTDHDGSGPTVYQLYRNQAAAELETGRSGG